MKNLYVVLSGLYEDTDSIWTTIDGAEKRRCLCGESYRVEVYPVDVVPPTSHIGEDGQWRESSI